MVMMLIFYLSMKLIKAASITMTSSLKSKILSISKEDNITNQLIFQH